MFGLLVALFCTLGIHAATHLEMTALSSLYNATNGDYWAWKEPSYYGKIWEFVDESADACVEGWQGIVCSGDSGNSTIVALTLEDYNLNGTLPLELSYLRNITDLSLRMNFMHGPLDVLCALTSLQTLVIKSNGFSGSLPTTLTKLSHLTEFNAELNSLSGTIPAALSLWTSLKMFHVSVCSFHGALPEALVTQWHNLVSFDISKNSFSGSVPEFAHQPYLEAISLADNAFTGSLKPLVFASTTLRSVDISANSISGTIPDSIGTCVSLSSLSFSSNELSGSLPKALTNLTALNLLSGFYNFITGSVPQELLGLAGLNFVNMLENFLTGTLSPNLEDATQLKYFNIAHNYITGILISRIQQKFFSVGDNFLSSTIPSTIFTETINLFDISTNLLYGTLPESINNSATLYHLNVGSNYLSGTVPSSAYSLTQVRVFAIANNVCSGTISDFVSRSFINIIMANNLFHGPIPSLALPHLESVDISANFLTGTIPDDILSIYAKFISYDNNFLESTIPMSVLLLTSMQFLDVSRNILTGALPSSLCQLSVLRSINVHSNRLTGRLPECYGETLISAVFSENSFSGVLPTQLTRASSLSVLKIQGNALTGHIDNVFSASSMKLVTVDLSDNKLSGTIPPDLFFHDTLVSIALVKNCFSGSIPTSICSATSLTVIAMDGLGAGKSCKRKLWDPWSVFGDTYFNDVMFHTLPSCVFTLSNLVTLHFSGNGLTGNIQSVKFPSSSPLTSLSLSHNRLTGTIPGGLVDRLLQFKEFDVSHNRFAGSIDLAVENVEESNEKLSLRVNRFSGDIPQWINRFDEVKVLSGNMFQCSKQSDLPSRDPDCDAYICGSGQLDSSLWVLFAALVGCICITLSMLYFSSQFSIFSWVANPNHCMLHLIATAHRMRNIDLVMSNYVNQIVNNTATPSLSTSEVNWMIYSIKSILNSARVVLVIVLILVLPCLVVLKLASDDSEKTQSHQYRWIVSAAYMSGSTSAVVLLLLWVFTITLSSFMLYRVHVQIEHDSRKSDILPKKFSRVQMTKFMSVIVVNVIVVFIANGAYIYIQLKDVSRPLQIFSQVSLAAFKLVWDTFAVGAAISWISSRRKDNLDERTLLYTALLVFNNIIAPCFVTAVTDDTCFKGLFEEADSVTVQYSNFKCTRYAVDVSSVSPYCSLYAEQIFETSYQPPFNYNYQCSSAILKSFIPVFFYAYAFMIFALPVMDVAICSVSPTRVPLFIRQNLAGVMWLTNAPDPNKPLIRVDRVIATLMRHLAVLLTFGFAYPLLGVGVVIAMIQYVWKWRLLIIRYVATVSIVAPSGGSPGDVPSDANSNALNHIDVHALVNKLNSDCRGSWRVAYACLWAVIWPGALFMGCLVFDVLGDEVGWKDAVWIFLAVFLIPLILWIFFTYTKYICKVESVVTVKSSNDAVQNTMLHEMRSVCDDDL